jgi:phage host-nuclease inhibitor protein Gam
VARIKPKNSINTQDQAVAAMGKLNQVDTQLAQWDLAEAEEIARVRENHVNLQRKANRLGLEAEKALLIKELEAWAQTASTAWERKTLETPFGRLGFRVSTPAVALVKRVVKNFKDAVELVMLYLPEFVRQSYEIDKEKILSAEREGTLETDKLARCGLTVEQKEEFWVETAASKDLDEASKKLKCA